VTDGNLVQRDQLIGHLSSALAHGGAGLNDVPVLLRKVLETDAWRERHDVRTAETVHFASFAEFVRTPPTHGLARTWR
jgi:hypothetical protein